METKWMKKAIIMEDEHKKEVASLEFKLHQNVYYLTSTYVDPSLRGQGVAGKLFDELMKKVKDSEAKVSPICSYSVAWFKKHPEYQEYLK